MPAAVATMPANPLAFFDYLWRSHHINLPHPHDDSALASSDPMYPAPQGPPSPHRASTAGVLHTVTHVFHHPHDASSLATHHLHHNRHTTESSILIPNVDIRETATHYIFDLEIPSSGGSKSSIDLRWVSDRELLVQGTSRRPPLELPASSSKSAKEEEEEEEKAGSDGSDLVRVDSHPEAPLDVDATTPVPIQYTCSCGSHVCPPSSTATTTPQPRLLLSERRIGNWERRFNFAVDFVEKRIKCRVEDGILTVWVRKNANLSAEGKKEEVEKKKAVGQGAVEWLE